MEKEDVYIFLPNNDFLGDRLDHGAFVLAREIVPVGPKVARLVQRQGLGSEAHLQHVKLRLCHAQSIDLAVFPRKAIYRCFVSVGAASWQDIAEAIGRQLDPLRALVPPRRKAWESEQRRMSIFAAAALAMVYWQLSGGVA